ncbi:FACT complex subunit POB3 [Tilletiaria anomala UBC 951]|uniref:FACT complex subunit POB3 n=1 Tax=Tilletiaria anomala (strain ATCC 24038 / CBS 436.72 / UBC 951) TaxID=1037660 RepID=A0A066WL08_TILAU|nr:FACT complex subunit POB3 [Tilletiaria anomala UBC 951]KDN51305.1 FACT complex subunit POB3 [Tilletiaria anomala UBC 951]
MAEEFNHVFFGLSSTVGRLRMSEGGLGWKPAGGEGSTVTEVADNFKSFEWLKVARNYQCRINLRKRNDRGEDRMTFDGFSRDDRERLAATIKSYYGMTLTDRQISTRGWNWGSAEIEQDDVQFLVNEKLAFEVPLSHIANSNVAGKTEVSIEFINPEQQQPTTNSGAATNGDRKSTKIRGDQLVEMRFFIPGNVEKGSNVGSDAEDQEEQTAASAFHEQLKAKADIGQVAGDGILLFKDVLVLTPRGRYDIDMFSSFLRLRGKTYDYKVLYSSITRLFLLPKPDDVHVQFVVGLDPAIRQGQTKYPYLVLQFPREEEMDAELNLDEEVIQDKYEGKLKKRYEEPTFKIVTNLFKVLSGQKLTVPTSFESSTGQSSIKCNVKATDGLLYPLEKAMLWVSKQPVYVAYADVHQIVFSRVGGAISSSKTFDLRVITKSGPEHHFQSLNREEHEKLNLHFAERKLRIKNEMAETDGALGLQVAAGMLSDEDEEMGAAGDDDDEDSEEDEDFQEGSSDEDGGSPSEASDDEDGGAGGKGGGKGDDSDSDAEMRNMDSPPKKKKRKS